MPRIKQRDLLPTAVRSRHISNFIFGSDQGVGSAPMGNGDGVTISMSLTQNDGFELVGHPYVSIYVGSVSAANQIFPVQGANQDITKWQITGPAFDWQTWADNGFPKHIEYVKITVENVSAGSVTIHVRNRWRYASPREGTK